MPPLHLSPTSSYTQTTTDPSFKLTCDAKFQGLLDETIDSYDDFHRNNDSRNLWKPYKKVAGFQFYTERKQAVDGLRSTLCSGIGPGKVEDILVGLHAPSSEDFRIRGAIVEPLWLDGSVIEVFESNPMTSETIFSGIKWVSHRSLLGFTTRRDLVIYDALGWTEDECGTKFGYHISFSVNLPGEDPSKQTNSENSYVQKTSLFHQVNDQFVGCYTRISVQVSKTVFGALVDFALSGHVHSYSNGMVCAKAKAYSALIAANADIIVPASPKCEICGRKPRILGKLRPCQSCRRCVCNRCGDHCAVFKMEPGTKKPMKEFFCRHCINDVEEHASAFLFETSRHAFHDNAPTIPTTTSMCDLIRGSSEYPMTVPSMKRHESDGAASLGDGPKRTEADTNETMRRATDHVVDQYLEFLKNELRDWNQFEREELRRHSLELQEFATSLPNDDAIRLSELD